MELPRFVMRGALVVVTVSLALALLLGLWRARQDMRDEIAAAAALAHVFGILIESRERSDSELIARLASLQSGNAWRHLELRLVDGTGRVRLEPAGDATVSAAMRALVALNGALFAPPASQRTRSTLARPDGSVWTLDWIASPAGEQREALSQVVADMAALACCGLVMLLVMRWNIRRAFRPLEPLLAAIARVEQDDRRAMRTLPAMPIRELDVIAAALRHLAEALEQAEARRRVLSVQLLTLQEDERGRIARELHDELGQHLTALRVDAAWLERRLGDSPEMARVVAGMGEQCARVQLELRMLLARLRPMGEHDGHANGNREGSVEADRLQHLRRLLETLVQSWADLPGSSTRYALEFTVFGEPGRTQLPMNLSLSVYRMSQEALTNIARHAHATQALLNVKVEYRAPVGATPHGLLSWTVADDGCGLDIATAWPRGNGLAGMKERVWANGGDLVIQSNSALPEGAVGLRLHAEFCFDGGGAEAHAGARRP